MNAINSRIGDSQSGDSLFADRRPADFPCVEAPSGPGRDAGDPLERLGRVLRGHTWRDSRAWARALDRLSRLSEDDLKRVIDASPEHSRP